MIKLLKNLSLVVLFVLIPCVVYAKPINDAIVAIVNSDVITLKDLKDYIANLYRQLKIEHKSEQEIQKIIASYEDRGVDQLIEDRLILAAANKAGIEIRPDIISKRLKEISSKYPSDADFVAELGTQGLTVSDIKKKITDQMKSKYVVDLEVREKIFVNPEQVTRYYNDHISEFESKIKYNLDSIFISFNKGKQEALNKIKEAREKLLAKQDMQKIIDEYSQASSVGTLEQGQMVPAIEKEVFSLKEGEISQPVIVDSGVYLFIVKGITQGNRQSIEQVKDLIYEKLFQMQFQDRFKAWIDKLKAKAYVEIR